MSIDKILKRNFITKKAYIGCFPCDRIPRIDKFPHCMVVNTERAYLPGAHWVGIYVRSKHHVEYFDSLGVWPPNKDIMEYLNKYKYIQYSKFIYNQITRQLVDDM